MLNYNQDIQSKIDEYKKNKGVWSQRQLAEAERDLYQALRKNNPRGLSRVIERRAWLRQLFGESENTYEARAKILAQDWAQPLWGGMDAGMSLTMAQDKFCEAKITAAKFEGDRAAALAVLLDPKAALKEAIAPIKRPTAKKSFTQQVEALWDKDLEASARGLNTETVRILKETYLRVIDEAHKAARGELSRLRRKRNEREAIRNLVSADQFRAACDTLNITVRFGGDVDLDDVRRKAAKTAAFFHPDKGPDPTGARTEQYRRVIKAREALEQYQEERTT